MLSFIWMVLISVVVDKRTEIQTSALIKAIPYATVHGKELCLDLAQPLGVGPFPAVVCIHGGAWAVGQREELHDLIRLLARNGYVAATISYHLLPDARFPQPLIDCKTALRFLRARADRYKIHKDRIAVYGFSAGGHLAALLGTTRTADGFDGDLYPKESSMVQAVVDFFGPTDLSYYGKDELVENSIFKPLLGGTFKDKPELFKRASPIHYVSRQSAPFLIFHGTADWVVPYEQSRSFSAKLKENGIRADLITMQGESHGWSRKKMRKSIQISIDFLNEYLKK